MPSPVPRRASDVGVHGPGDPRITTRRTTRTCARARKAAWSLYDFANTIFSFAIVSGAIGLWLTDDSRFGPATGQLGAVDRDHRSASASTRSCRRCWARSRTAAAGGSRSCSRSPRCAIAPTAVIGHHRPDRRRAPVHRRELLVPGGAHLLRRVAQAREHAGDARPAVGHRDGDRLLRHGVRRAADLRSFDIPVEARFLLAALLFALFAIPCSSSSARRTRARRRARSRRRDVAELVGPARRRSRHAARGARACCASCSGGSSTPTR